MTFFYKSHAMKSALPLCAVALLFQTAHLCGQTAAVLGELRGWQRESGGAFTAALRGLEGGKVILQSADGRTATMELAALSRNDRDYVRGKIGVLTQRWLEQLTPAKSAADRSGWPTIVHVPLTSLNMVVKRPFEAGKGMRFASAHFEFESAAEISPAEQRSIATPFELIHEVWRLAPWGVFTPPKDGGPFQVELFLNTDAYAAAGAPPNSGAHFDSTSKKLRVLGSAIGLDVKRQPLWRDEQAPVPALAYGMVPLLMQRFMAMIPDWIIPSLALVMRDLPIKGGAAWPRELLSSLNTSTASTRLTEAELRLYLDPMNNREKFPLDQAKLMRLACYFIQGDGSQGGNLRGFLSAAAADLPQWDAFLQRLQDIKTAEEKRRSDPSVTVPEMLPVPNRIDRPDQMRWFHVPKLLGGSDAVTGMEKTVKALTNSP